MTEQEKIDKLPTWAKNKISLLQSNIDTLKLKLNQVNGISETNTVILDFLEERPLPNNSIVRFKVDMHNTITVRVESDTININADSRNGKRFILAPRAANSINLMFVKE